MNPKLLLEEETLNIYKIIKEFEADDECRSDVSLAYLNTYWRIQETPQYDFINKNVVLILYDIETKERFTAIFGENKLEETILKVFEFQKINNLDQAIYMVSESQVNKIQNTSLKILHDRNLDEYILNNQTLIEFNDPLLRKLKQTVNNFSNNFGDKISTKELDANDDSVILNIINSLHVWDHRSKNNDPDIIEKKYNEAMLLSAVNSGVKIHAVFISEHLIGYCLYSIDKNKSFGLPHIIKTDTNIRHSFDFTLYTFSEYLSNIGIKFMNAEEDMGIEGIRFKKTHLAPVKMQKRYVIKPS